MTYGLSSLKRRFGGPRLRVIRRQMRQSALQGGCAYPETSLLSAHVPKKTACQSTH